MFKGNMSKLLKQAQDMQQKIQEAQGQLSKMIVEAESGGGMVKVKINGNQEILELIIDPESMTEEKEMLEDLIISALNKGLKKSKSDSQEKINSITGGMMSNMKIPGL